MATISKLVVSLEANSAKLVKTLASSRKRFKKWASDASSAVKSIGKAFTVVSSVAIAGFIVAINRSAANIDKITKAAGKLKFPIEDYQRFSHIASLSNIEMDNFGKSMQRMLKTVGDARDGLSTATGAFEALGLSWDDLAQMSPSKQFELIAQAMQGLPTHADKVKVAMDIFGRSGADLLNVFESDVAALGKEFDDLGITITASQVQAVAAFQDSKTKLGALLGGITDNVTATLAPALTDIVERTKEWIKEFGGGKKLASVVSKAILKGIGSILKGLSKMRGIFNDFKIDLNELKQDWLKFNYPIDLKFDTSDASMRLAALIEQRKVLEETASKNRKSIQEFDDYANGFVDKFTSVIDDAYDKSKAAGGKGGISDSSSLKELTDANNVAADSATKFAEILKEVNGSSVWQDIFKKEEVTARSNQFDDVARNLRNAIDSGSSNQASLLNHLKQIVETASKNKQVFTNEGTFGAVDIKGMTEVLLGLTRLIDAKDGSNPLALAAEKLATSNAEQGVQFKEFMNKLNSKPQLANVELSFLTDTGKVAGEIFAEPEFVERLKAFNERQQQNGTRADTA